MNAKIILASQLQLGAKHMVPDLQKPFIPYTMQEISLSLTHTIGENVTH